MTRNQTEAAAKAKRLAAMLSDADLVTAVIETDKAQANDPSQVNNLVRVWTVQAAEERWLEASRLVGERFDEEMAHYEATHEDLRIDYVGTLVGALRALEVIGDGDLTR